MFVIVVTRGVLVAVDEFEAVMPAGLVTDSKTLERLTERSYVRDWTRQGIITNTNSSSKTKDPFRVTSVNSAYMMCPR